MTHPDLDYDAELSEAVDLDAETLTVPDIWQGFPGTAFGGFVAGAVLVATSSRTEHPRPLSIFARFHRPIPLAQKVNIQIRSERRGRTVETYAAELRNQDKLLASFSVSFGRDGDTTLDSQAVPVMAPLVRPRPVWQYLEEVGVNNPGTLMRRIGFRSEPADVRPSEDDSAGWHLRSDWPAATSSNLHVRAAVAIMAIDSFVAPATMRANQVDMDGPWPVMMPSLDLTGWFYAPEAEATEAGEGAPGGWLSTRTAVPVSHAGYAVGHTQVWMEKTLVAEGMSQVALVPAPQ